MLKTRSNNIKTWINTQKIQKKLKALKLKLESMYCKLKKNQIQKNQKLKLKIKIKKYILKI